MSSLINKILSVYLFVKYPRVERSLRYFYRDTIRCKIAQSKYFIADYFSKRSYKDIEFEGEFGMELQFVIPFAYWHYKNGTLKSTASARFTKEFYFFSPSHKEKFESRTNKGNYNFELPRILYSHDYKISKWVPVPLKAHYENSIYRFEKPILIIANRFNMEWDGPPVSFFDVEMLDFIICKLKKAYTIIYNRPKAEQITTDDSEIYDLGEHEWLKRDHPEVLLLNDIYERDKRVVSSFNHLQLLVYSNSKHFISIHGGTATLASYFGGINLIYSEKGPEHHFGCFEKLYPKLSGAKILHAKQYSDVKKFIESYY